MRILDPAPSTKDSEIADIWLLTSQELMKIYTVDDVAISINGFRPELPWSLVLIKHRSSHLDKGSILALHDAILLRSIRSK